MKNFLRAVSEANRKNLDDMRRSDKRLANSQKRLEHIERKLDEAEANTPRNRGKR